MVSQEVPLKNGAVMVGGVLEVGGAITNCMSLHVSETSTPQRKALTLTEVA